MGKHKLQIYLVHPSNDIHQNLVPEPCSHMETSSEQLLGMHFRNRTPRVMYQWDCKRWSYPTTVLCILARHISFYTSSHLQPGVSDISLISCFCSISRCCHFTLETSPGVPCLFSLPRPSSHLRWVSAIIYCPGSHLNAYFCRSNFCEMPDIPRKNPQVLPQFFTLQ